MISLEANPDVASSSPFSMSSPDEESTLSFSELLRGAGKKDAKVIQNGALVLSFGGDEKDIKTISKSTTKNDALLSLLKNDEKREHREVLELNPKLTQTLTSKELKILISDAKEYLKSKIVNSDEYKKAQIEELPKTLKGLATLAKKIGVDISKITIQEVEISKEQNIKPTDIKVKNLQTKETNVLDEKILKPEVKNNEHIVDKKKDSVRTVKVANEIGIVKSQNKMQDLNIVEDKKTQTIKQSEIVKPTLLFKAQSSHEHMTEQIVQTKQFKIEVKTPKEKADDTLKLLLRGEKPLLTNNKLTADFSVATARVIAPSASTDVSKSLELLLHGEQSESTTPSKTDGLTTHKADSFEVKLNEAKQMIKYISQDVKTAIEDYKSPFTRIKVQLNPQKLGEVDLTIVQRGKNLHVNISSNNTAINTLSMNANELRVQLSNSGINNATLNFNSGSENGSSNNEHQQNRQNEQNRANEEYNHFDNEEENEEILSSLEIVVPDYA